MGFQSTIPLEAPRANTRVSSIYEFLENENKCTNWTQNAKKGMKFVFFFGYDRSGSTVLGRILDAHPHALIANEYKLFDELSRKLTGTEAVENICEKSTRENREAIVKDEGYKISMGAFGGRYLAPLQLIGVKRSMIVTILFERDPVAFKRGMDKIAALGFEMIGVISVRNPFDMIVTNGYRNGPVMRTIRFIHPNTSQIVYSSIVNISRLKPPLSEAEFVRVSRKGMIEGSAKIFRKDDVDWLIWHTDKIAGTCERLMNTFSNFKYITVHNEELIQNPVAATRQLCLSLGLECYKEFEEGVVRGLFEKPAHMRNGIDWSPEQIARVEQIVKRHPRIFTKPQYTKLDSL